MGGRYNSKDICAFMGLTVGEGWADWNRYGTSPSYYMFKDCCRSATIQSWWNQGACGTVDSRYYESCVEHTVNGVTWGYWTRKSGATYQVPLWGQVWCGCPSTNTKSTTSIEGPTTPGECGIDGIGRHNDVGHPVMFNGAAFANPGTTANGNRGAYNSQDICEFMGLTVGEDWEEYNYYGTSPSYYMFKDCCRSATIQSWWTQGTCGNVESAYYDSCDDHTVNGVSWAYWTRASGTTYQVPLWGQVWCGCPPTTTTTSITSSTTTTSTATGTTTSITATTTTSTTATDFDCEAGLSRWKDAWSVTKKVWCCHHLREGCEYNCDAGSDLWEEDWSEDKKAWCCFAEDLGCTTTTTAPTPVPTPNPNLEILERLEVGLEKLEVLEENLANLEEIHQTTATTLPETTLPETTTTTWAEVCTAKRAKHEGWCRLLCGNPNKFCKSLCPERCVLSTCRCKQRPRSRRLQEIDEEEVEHNKSEKGDQDGTMEEKLEGMLLV